MIAFRILIGVLTMVVFAAANVFAYRRLIRDTMEAKWLRIAFGVLLIAQFLAVPVVRYAFGDELPPPGFSTVVLFAWGVFIYAFLTLVVIEGARWLIKRRTPKTEALEDPKRRLFISRAAAAGALTVGGSVGSFGAWRAFTPAQITEVPVKLPGLPRALDGFTLVQLSDVHIGSVLQERYVDQLVATANSAKPDLICITGDLVDGSPDQLGRFVARLRNLESRFGTHFVSGNHDYYSGWERWATALEGIDFEVLRNRFVTIGSPGASFDLIGVDDWGSRMGRGGYDLEKATAGRDPERASVLMAHQPNGLDLVVQKKIGLQLSGHTHGGQMFPGTLFGDIIWGNRNTGLSLHEQTSHLYTSRGCGFVGPPMRVGAPPEVVKIILVAG